MKTRLLLLSFMLFGILSASAQEQATAVLDKAYAQAKKENKKVLLIFHASWCGWCKKMDANMTTDATKKLFTDNYVIAHLTVQESPKNKALENAGGDVVLKKYGGDRAGLPFWVILDANGSLLADSFTDKKENSGCPSSPEEVADFTAKLKKTSKLNDKQLAIITETFVLKK